MPFLLQTKHAFHSQSSESGGEELGDEEVVDDLLSMVLSPKCRETSFAQVQDVLNRETHILQDSSMSV